MMNGPREAISRKVKTVMANPIFFPVRVFGQRFRVRISEKTL